MKRSVTILVFSLFLASTVFAAEWRRFLWVTRVIYDQYDVHKRTAHVIITLPREDGDGLFKVVVNIGSTEFIFKQSSSEQVVAEALSLLRVRFPDFPDISQGI